MPDLKPVYFWYGGKLNDRWQDYTALTIDGAHHPMEICRDEVRPEGEVVYFGSLDATGRFVIHLERAEYAVVPPVWFVLQEHPEAQPPHVILRAFACSTFPVGTVVDAADAIAAGVQVNSQIAAIQWGHGDPNLQQVFVHPEWRRRHLALAMIGAADLVNMCRGFSGGRALYGGDVTTAGGEHLREAWSSSPRVSERIGAAEPVEAEGTGRAMTQPKRP